MKINILSLGCMIVLLAGFAQAELLPTTDPARFEGYVFINGANATDANILVYVDGVLNKIVTSSEEAYYVATAEGATGDVVTFKVNGVSAGSSSVFDAFSVTLKNLSMTRASSGESCVSGYDWSDLGCTSSLVCCSNTCRSSCSSGGGGGSSGGTTQEFQGIIFPLLTGGVPSFGQNNGSQDVRGINLTSVGNATNVRIAVSTLDGQPSGVPLPEGTVFEYITMTPQGLSDSNVAVAIIKFRVLKSWYTDNNLNLSSTKINRFHDGVWEILDTVMVSSDDMYYYFEAETPGFSTFAITAKPNAAPVTPTTCSNTCANGQSQKSYPDCSCVAQPEQNQTTGEPTIPGEKPPVQDNGWILYILAAIVVIVITFFAFGKVKKKRHSQV